MYESLDNLYYILMRTRTSRKNRTKPQHISHRERVYCVFSFFFPFFGWLLHLVPLQFVNVVHIHIVFSCTYVLRNILRALFYRHSEWVNDYVRAHAHPHNERCLEWVNGHRTQTTHICDIQAEHFIFFTQKKRKVTNKPNDSIIR